MKLKKEYLVLIVVIVALTLYLAMRSKDQTHFELPALAAVESKTINRLLITQAGETVELNKTDDQWHIAPQKYLADSIKVNNMVKAAADLMVTALVSESESYQRYGLDDASKTTLQALTDKQVLRNVDIGRVAPTHQHTFVKLNGDAKVYHARGNIKRTFEQTVDELRDKSVLQFDKAAITSLRIEKGEHNLIFNKSEQAPAEKKEGEEKIADAPPKPQWLAADGQVADQAHIQQLINSFFSVKCDAYMADDAKNDLKDALWTLKFMAAEKTHRISLFAASDAEADQYPASSSDNDYAFLLNKHRVETFEKQINAILKIEAPAES